MLQCSVYRPYKLGDLERDLPEGMFLHRMYNRRRHEPIVKLLKSPAYQLHMQGEDLDEGIERDTTGLN